MAIFSKSQTGGNEHPNLVPCKDCDHPVSKDAEVCPSCGRRISGSRTDQVATLIFVLMLLSLLAAFFGMGTRHG